ncbi:AAA family ATPase, partial [uncultured Anaerovibrio sp.]|uniref:nucleotide-binding protein n=1 Tax=uncultured Anaerovibrio sp. TaxID=361586 RepID=UPI0025FC85CA
MECNIPRLVIAATKSGSGKTTIVTGLLAALKDKGLKVQPYKVGPDYIDPGYHSLISGQPSHNLDSWLMPKEVMREVFANNGQTADMALIEGVMGLYDGGNKGISSTAEVAKLLEAPVVLVIDCKSMGASAAALALGFRDYDPSVRLAGVILNRLGSDNHERIIREAMEQL